MLECPVAGRAAFEARRPAASDARMGFEAPSREDCIVELLDASQHPLQDRSCALAGMGLRQQQAGEARHRVERPQPFLHQLTAWPRRSER